MEEKRKRRKAQFLGEKTGLERRVCRRRRRRAFRRIERFGREEEEGLREQRGLEEAQEQSFVVIPTAGGEEDERHGNVGMPDGEVLARFGSLRRGGGEEEGLEGRFVAPFCCDHDFASTLFSLQPI